MGKERLCDLCQAKIKPSRGNTAKFCMKCQNKQKNIRQKNYVAKKKIKMDNDINYRNQEWFKVFKQKAKQRNIKVEIDYQEFVTLMSLKCFYCDDVVDTIGIDRVDNDKHYTFNNTVRCCITCNKMKLDLNTKDFYKQIFKIANNYSRTKLFMAKNKIMLFVSHLWSK